MYQDLRQFITLVDKLGALRRIEGADPKFEIGGITEVAAGSADCPALLFERMQGCAPGFRVFTNATTTPARAALAPARRSQRVDEKTKKPDGVSAGGRKNRAVSRKFDAR
jgi:UbiD family decarboxylase